MELILKLLTGEERPNASGARARPLCDRVREWVDAIDERGRESKNEWEKALYLFNKLAKKPKLSREEKRAFDMLEDIMEKYGASSDTELAATYPHEEE